MTPAAADALRRSAAHLLVDDVELPVLADADAHHLFRVLRVRDGEIVSVTDGAGRWRSCRAGGGAIVPVGDVSVEPPSASRVTIGVAIPKMDRPEWIVQKLTEVGVDRVVLLHADRSVVRWDDQRAAKHRRKLERVAAEALQQSRRVFRPVIEGPVAADEFLPSAVAADPGGRPLSSADTCIAVGPEGGWSDRELALALDRVGLGSTVLRVETAALVAASRALCHRE